MAAILNSAILNLVILDSATLVFPLKLTHTCQDWFPPFAQRKPLLIHSDSTWWWQTSWILPCWIETPCFLLSDSLKNTLTSTLTLTQTNLIWLKLISFSLNLMMAAILEFCHLEFGHLGFSHLSFSSQTHSHLPRLVPTIWTKKNLHSFILTELDDGSHLEFYHVGFRHCHLGFRHLLIFSQIHSKTLSLHSESN